MTFGFQDFVSPISYQQHLATESIDDGHIRQARNFRNHLENDAPVTHLMWTIQSVESALATTHPGFFDMTLAEMDTYLQTRKPVGMDMEEATPTPKIPSSLANAAAKHTAPVENNDDSSMVEDQDFPPLPKLPVASSPTKLSSDKPTSSGVGTALSAKSVSSDVNVETRTETESVSSPARTPAVPFSVPPASVPTASPDPLVAACEASLVSPALASKKPELTIPVEHIQPSEETSSAPSSPSKSAKKGKSQRQKDCCCSETGRLLRPTHFSEWD